MKSVLPVLILTYAVAGKDYLCCSCSEELFTIVAALLSKVPEEVPLAKVRM